MIWNSLIFTGISLYGTFKLVGFARRRDSLKFWSFSITSLLFLLVWLATALEGVLNRYELTIYSDVVIEWGNILTVSFLLCSLALLIRESKPGFAQFPLVYTGLPLFIIIAHLLVIDTLAIKDWLLSIYQGGALVVALLMYGVYTYRYRQFGVILSGTVLFLFSYILYWFVPVIREDFTWVWQLLLGIAYLATILGFEWSMKEEGTHRLFRAAPEDEYVKGSHV